MKKISVIGATLLGAAVLWASLSVDKAQAYRHHGGYYPYSYHGGHYRYRYHGHYYNHRGYSHNRYRYW